MGMLGRASQPQCDLHGADTNGMLAFANLFLLVRFGHLLGERRPHFTGAASSLVNLLDVIREYPTVVPPRMVQRLCDEVLCHIKSCQALEMPLKPKHHMLMEMGVRMRRQGSPALAACWRDDSDNEILKSIAAHSHPVVFHRRVLTTWRQFPQRAAARKRKTKDAFRKQMYVCHACIKQMQRMSPGLPRAPKHCLPRQVPGMGRPMGLKFQTCCCVCVCSKTWVGHLLGQSF